MKSNKGAFFLVALSNDGFLGKQRESYYYRGDGTEDISEYYRISPRIEVENESAMKPWTPENDINY